jgi:glycosyltransferase involved in cell wall biosynthesis
MADVREREAYLVPNKNVLLYEPGNAEDLADKIRTIVSNKKLAEEMRKNNLKLACQFDWQVLVEQSGLLEKILKN